MKGTQHSFVSNVKPKKFDGPKAKGTPTADCNKIRDLLLSYPTLTARHKESKKHDEIFQATVLKGKCMVRLKLSGKLVRLDDWEIIEDLGFVIGDE
jgi:hypothetical protein